MNSRILHVAVGVVVYVALVLALFGFSKIAFPGGAGSVPVWFASAQVLLEAVGSVTPGLLVGWLSRKNGFVLGAITGVLGAILGDISQLFMLGLPAFELGFRLSVGMVSAAAAAAFTNAVGAIAGVALRSKAARS